MTPLVSSISSALRNGLAVPDARFDRLFPFSERLRSRMHWTPVEIAMRASKLLAAGSARRVLDVGSGVGKFCLVGALTTRARWTGIEKDARMIEAARAAAVRLGVDHHVEFLQGDATKLDWSCFDAIYLFNPFWEILLDSDLDPVLRRDRYVETIMRAQHRLAETNPGTRVVTCHGFGGDMPEGFRLLQRQPAHDDELCLWMRMRRVTRSIDALRGDPP